MPGSVIAIIIRVPWGHIKKTPNLLLGAGLSRLHFMIMLSMLSILVCL